MKKSNFLNKKIYGIKIDYILVVVMLTSLISMGVITGKWKKKKFYDNYALTVGKPLKKSYSGTTKRKVNYHFKTRYGILVKDRSDYPYGSKIDFDKKYIIAYCESDPKISFLLLGYKINGELGDVLDSLESKIYFEEIPWWEF